MASKKITPSGNVVASGLTTTAATSAASVAVWPPGGTHGFGALNDCVCYIRGIIVGIEHNGGSGYSGSVEVLATVERRSGVLVITNQNVLYADAIVTTAAFNLNSGNLEMKITPNTAASIDWYGIIKLELAYEYQ